MPSVLTTQWMFVLLDNIHFYSLTQNICKPLASWFPSHSTLDEAFMVIIHTKHTFIQLLVLVSILWLLLPQPYLTVLFPGCIDRNKPFWRHQSTTSLRTNVRSSLSLINYILAQWPLILKSSLEDSQWAEENVMVIRSKTSLCPKLWRKIGSIAIANPTWRSHECYA